MSSLRQKILAALIQGPAFGLEIHDRLRQRAGTPLASIGALYPVLRDLERDGLLASFPGENVPTRGGRPRIYYELTGDGRQVVFEERDHEAGWAGGVPVPV